MSRRIAARVGSARYAARAHQRTPVVGEAGPNPALTRNRRPSSPRGRRRAGAPATTRPDHIAVVESSGWRPGDAPRAPPAEQREGTHASLRTPRRRPRGGAGPRHRRPRWRRRRRRRPPRPTARRQLAAGPGWPTGALERDRRHDLDVYKADLRLRRLRADHRRRARAGRASAATDGVGRRQSTGARSANASTSWTTAPGSSTRSSAGATAKALVLAQAAGRRLAVRVGPRPGQARGDRLVSRATHRGRIQDTLDPATSSRPTTPTRSARRSPPRRWHRSNSPCADAVTGFLLEQQCAGGYFRRHFAGDRPSDQTCDGAPDRSGHRRHRPRHRST